MAFSQFPDRLTVRVMETNEEADMGTYSMSSSIEISQLVLTFLKHGTEGGSERLRIRAYEVVGASVAENPTSSTEWVNLSDVQDSSGAAMGTYFLGTIKFEFATPIRGSNYELRLDVDNYTRNADTYYLAYVFDHPKIVNSRSTPNETGAQCAIIQFNNEE